MRLSTLFRGVPLLLVAAAPIAPPRALVLVVAGWCAPCRGELARLAELAAAAQPLTLRVVALDDARSTRELMATVPAPIAWRLSPADRARLADAVYARSAGLPYAFATDASGSRCADTAGGLDAAKTRALVARCAP